jgi:DNA repair exonuclease SbcCD ATPase subunit
MELRLQLEKTHVRKHADAVARGATRAFLRDNPAFQQLMNEIGKFQEKIEQISDILEHTLQGEYEEAIQTYERDKNEELNAKIRAINVCYNVSTEIERKLQQARQELSKNEGRLTKREKELQEDIERLNGEIQTKPFAEEYKRKLQEYEKFKAVVEGVQDRLERVRKGIDETVKTARRALAVLERSIPRVERIYIYGSTDVFVNNKPLTFSVRAAWLDMSISFDVSWAPGCSMADLYNSISSRMIEEVSKNL